MRLQMSSPATSSLSSNGPRLPQVDHALHGLAGIRLLNATESDAAAATRQLGPIQATLTREPDIVVRVVDRLPPPPPGPFLGVGGAGVCQAGALPMPSSAFAYNGTGVFATGWSKGGNSETLLAYMPQGDSYIGDEWVYI